MRKPFIFMIPVAKAGVPNSNGDVYTRECLEKMAEDMVENELAEKAWVDEDDVLQLVMREDPTKSEVVTRNLSGLDLLLEQLVGGPDEAA